ncbi:MAG: DUF1328 domain-containing protein [Bacteroidetes bacterium]|nr:DUF1328 domain-containing protein [Bacteroidota bacterium]
MLRYAVIFFVIALVAAVFGFGGIAAGAVSIALILFFHIFCIISVEFNRRLYYFQKKILTISKFRI